MHTSNIIAFPFTFRPPPPARIEGFPPPPLRADGTPLRPGDQVALTAARLRDRSGNPMTGMITEVTRPGGMTGMCCYGVMCADGIFRMVRQDNLTAAGNAAQHNNQKNGGGYDAA